MTEREIPLPHVSETFRLLWCQLQDARAAMILALDALEADADQDARREAFAVIQAQFSGVSLDEHADAERRIPILKAREEERP